MVLVIMKRETLNLTIALINMLRIVKIGLFQQNKKHSLTNFF